MSAIVLKTCGKHVSAAEVIKIIRKLSNGKAARIDVLSGDSLKYANHILSVLLSIYLLLSLNTAIFLSACLTQL